MNHEHRHDPHAAETPGCGNDCGSILEHLFEYLDGEMGDDDCSRFAQHLAECPPCLVQYQRDQALKALIRRSCACEQAPQQLRTQIIARFTSIRIEYH